MNTNVFVVAMPLMLCGLLACSNPSPAPAPTLAKAKVEPPAPQPMPPQVPTAIVDIPSIASASLSEVEDLHGAPVGCETVNPSGVGKAKKCGYLGGNLEVVYINDKADWITVYGSQARSPDHPKLKGVVGPKALEQLGLSAGQGTSGPISLSFVGTVEGIRSVTLFQETLSNKTLNYAYVKVHTD